ncbi:MAG: hypothetical protein LBF69_06485 [Prevotellaceae bacterium]|jgi:hypothetical protein|nr:hypothetical protein [Prevotellaceae bacterium]
MASIYDLDDVGFVGGQFKKPEEDSAFFTAYFKKLRAERSKQKNKKLTSITSLTPITSLPLC